MVLKKEKWREEYKKRRDALSIEDHKRMSQWIKERFINDIEYQRSSTILFFVSFRSEVDTLPLIERALKEDKRVLVPITDTKSNMLHLSQLKSLRELEEGTYSIMEPAAEYLRPLPYKEVELVLVPGLVFDERGYRIGYGGGYYDRLLLNLDQRVRRIGLAFELQLVERLSLEDHDLPVHKVITEERTILIKEGAI